MEINCHEGGGEILVSTKAWPGPLPSPVKESSEKKELTLGQPPAFAGQIRVQ